MTNRYFEVSFLLFAQIAWLFRFFVLSLHQHTKSVLKDVTPILHRHDKWEK